MQNDVVLHGRAYVVSGDENTLPEVLALLARHDIDASNPDLYVRRYSSFGIDDARDVRRKAEMRPLARPERVFVILAPVITVDAQNALLKTLEEPPAGACFFLIVPSPTSLLPTLRSRVHIIALDSKQTSGDVDTFLAALPEKRIEMMKSLYAKSDDDERDISRAVTFLEELERALAPRAVKDPSVRVGIRAVYRAREYITDKGSLLKTLVEQVALLTPRL